MWKVLIFQSMASCVSLPPFRVSSARLLLVRVWHYLQGREVFEVCRQCCEIRFNLKPRLRVPLLVFSSPLESIGFTTLLVCQGCGKFTILKLLSRRAMLTLKNMKKIRPFHYEWLLDSVILLTFLLLCKNLNCHLPTLNSQKSFEKLRNFYSVGSVIILGIYFISRQPHIIK